MYIKLGDIARQWITCICFYNLLGTLMFYKQAYFIKNIYKNTNRRQNSQEYLSNIQAMLINQLTIKASAKVMI